MDDNNSKDNFFFFFFDDKRQNSKANLKLGPSFKALLKAWVLSPKKNWVQRLQTSFNRWTTIILKQAKLTYPLGLMEFTILASSYFPLTFFFILEVLNFVDWKNNDPSRFLVLFIFSPTKQGKLFFSTPFLSPIHLFLNHIIRKHYLRKIFCVMSLLPTLTLLVTYYLTLKIYFVT